MPGITRWYHTERPCIEEELDSIRFPSPDGEYALLLYDRYEFAMGGYHWDFKLSHGDLDITPHLTGFERIFYYTGYQPWGYDNDNVALHPFGRLPVSLFSLSSKRLIPIETEQYIFNIQGAPDINRFLLSGRSGGILVDSFGNTVTSVPWSCGEINLPYTFWLNSGQLFFMINQNSQLQFFSGENGSIKQSIDIMPADYIPGSTLKCKWENPQFDRATNTLYVTIFRRFEEQWVAFEIEP